MLLFPAYPYIADNFSETSYGIYRLSLPTGAGKTLASLGYALKVAAKRKTSEVSHIFYISPYISITEQSTEVIKKAVGNEEWVMEHHSNVSNSDEQEKQIDTAWKEPIICTTMIQFLYTFAVSILSSSILSPIALAVSVQSESICKDKSNRSIQLI